MLPGHVSTVRCVPMCCLRGGYGAPANPKREPRSARQAPTARMRSASKSASWRSTDRAISQMESSEREGTIRVATMTRALEALGQDLLMTSTVQSRLSRYAPARLSHDVSIALGKGDKPTAMRLITQSAEHLRNSRAHFDPDEIDAPPAHLPDPGMGCLLPNALPPKPGCERTRLDEGEAAESSDLPSR